MIIADSSGLFSLLIETDYNHSKAITIQKNFLRNVDSVVIPSDVFSEVVNILGKKFSHLKAYKIAKALLEAKIFIIECPNEIMIDKALEKFKKQKESTSFTDCVVMAFADYFETKEIFGFDKVFTNNGYKMPI